MIFLKTLCGAEVSMNRIREVRDGPDEGQVTLCLDGGGERWARKVAWQQAQYEAAQTIVPAPPGIFRLFKIVFDEVRVQVMRTPIIGWIIDAKGGVEPVTSSKAWCDEDMIIEYPNGTVEELGSIYTSMDEWVSVTESCLADSHKSEVNAH